MAADAVAGNGEVKFMNRALSTQASAGSGKTYRLASRYIELLKFIIKNKSQTEEIPEILIPNSVGSIIALTFTNKAAAEMKDRIITFLKKIAKIYLDEKFHRKNFGLKEGEAFKLLVDIIKNYGDFNVTTLDSFMNRILKAFSIEKKILPDYEVIFESEKVFELAFGEIVADLENYPQLLEFLKKLLELDYSGFNPEKILFKGLEKYQYVDIPDNLLLFENLKTKLGFGTKSFAEIQAEIEENIKISFEYFRHVFAAHEECFNKTNIKKFYKTEIGKIIENLQKYEDIVDDGNLNSLYKKGCTISEKIESEFLSKLALCVNLLKKYILLKSSFETDVVALELKNLRAKEDEIKRVFNIVDGQRVAKDVSEILKENDISYAFLKLGEKISHYLIDEFQDTSKQQFMAISPLIENALAEGGTLFIVGDKKQAIYGWRGGDYTIFDEALGLFGLDEEFINTNYRSAKNIVEFNNYIFKTENILNRYLTGLFKEDLSGEFNDIMTEAIKSIYVNSYQECKSEIEGYIEISLKNSAEDVEEFYKKQFIEIFCKVINDYQINPADIMILLRKKDDIKTVISWMREYFAEIPFVTEDSMNITSKFEIKKLLYVSKILTMPESEHFDSIFEELEIDKAIVSKIRGEISFCSPYEIFSKIILNIFSDCHDSRIYFERFLEEVLKISDKYQTLEDVLEYFSTKKDITISLNENIQAVKIMTIHKSKGLESHTVIIPFYEWRLYDKGQIKDMFEVVNIKEFTGVDDYLLMKLTKARDFVQDGKQKYFEKFKNEIIENLNLMYVANTRPRENLYIIAGYKKDEEKGKYSKQLTVADLLYIILEESDYEYEIDEEGVEKVKIGEPKKCLKGKSAESLSDKESFILSADLRSHLKIYEKEAYFDLEQFQRLKGELFHLGMSFVGKVDFSSDVDIIINNSYEKASKLMRYYDEDVKGMMKRCLFDLKIYFEDIATYWNEKEFVDNFGNIMRLDRVVEKGDEFVIIDYKTGLKDELHKSQLKRYMRLFKNCRGIIYYAENGDIIDVV